MSRCKKCGCQIESPFDGKTVIHNVEACRKFTGQPAPSPRSSTATLIKALAIMAKEDRSEDGIAGAALMEASKRLGEMEEALGCVVVDCGYLHHGKSHRHEAGQLCPAEQLILKARGDCR